MVMTVKIGIFHLSSVIQQGPICQLLSKNLYPRPTEFQKDQYFPINYLRDYIIIHNTIFCNFDNSVPEKYKIINRTSRKKEKGKTRGV